MKRSFVAMAFILLMVGCQTTPETVAPSLSQTEHWQLGWRMIVSTFEEDFSTAAQQFDSLRAYSDTVELRFLIAGLEVLEHLGQMEKRDSILALQSEYTWGTFCQKGLYLEQKPAHIPCTRDDQQPQDTVLQRQLIAMEVRDQLARGNVQDYLIEAFRIDTSGMSYADGVKVDAENREALKAIIEAHGFPTAELVGEEGMHAVFILIQHADRDPEWQKAQLPYIEAAVKNGGLDGQDYAYLYDRIQVNAEKPQRYGTQFSKVDPATKTIELAAVEDPDNLNQRRMEVGMMPIEAYRALVLSRFQ
ncbi:DUF6624 domain-containing protein [Phaeodactylibacter sp.]|jgi:hypothetical protein|uniref:DUF6624 domain-containing protein n=1 Tax=Phaeodactylibacter sp. TaxID=1940289 RepID=UPI0025CD28FC|nr:DUF6624 domain-containing protein [Phaeodactylibacter sp.]MCI4650406.1 hypothetical protein [Phaeodactylibacter sp.]MCI5094268.1 hypothetical protein [Phaeodactylibacter sp.]